MEFKFIHCILATVHFLTVVLALLVVFCFLGILPPLFTKGAQNELIFRLSRAA
jgi:hypothetical protein